MVQPFLPNKADAFTDEQSYPDSVDFDILARQATESAPTGVVSGGAVTESGTPAQTIDVTACDYRIGGRPYSYAGGTGISVTAADGSNPRIDLISVNTSEAIVVTAGTPAAAATVEAPAVPADNVVLAFLYVPASDNTHNNVQIVDKRLWVESHHGIFNIEWYGAVADNGTTDNSTAFQAAVDDAYAVNGTVIIPAHDTWYEVHGIDLDGAWGLSIVGFGEGSQLRNTGGSESVFLIGYTSTLHNATFRNFRVTTTVAGKAAFEVDGMFSCRFENVMMNSYVPTSRNVMSNTVTGWTGIFDCTWSDCSFSCDGVAQSVPLFDIVDVDSDRFNSNTIKGGRVTGSTSCTSVLFKFSSQHTNSYHYQNTIQGVNFEIPNYGAIECEGANGWTFDTIGGYDQDATMSGSFIRLGKHASGNESVGCHIVNCTNISLQSRGSYYDIETQGDWHTIINSGGHNTSGLLDFNDENVTVIGCGRSTLTGIANATIVDYDGTLTPLVGDSATTERITFASDDVTIYDGDNAKRLEILNGGDINLYDEDGTTIIAHWDETDNEFVIDAHAYANPPTRYTTTQTLTAKDRLVNGDGTAFTITLPAISSLTLPHFVTIFAGGSGNITVDPGTDNIDGSTADKVLTGGESPPAALALVCYNATDDWETVSEQGTVT